MFEWLQVLFSTTGFMPHGHCYLWKPTILGMHVISDLAIFLSYSAIPFAIVWFVRQRKDLPFSWVFVLFGIFIIACGFTHLLAVITVWKPVYWLTGFVKVITAIASVLTAMVLFPLLPKALALPSPAMLQAANDKLTTQINERMRIEAEVILKNAELKTVNDALKASLNNLKQTQEQLIAKEKMASLGGLVAGVAHELNTPLGIGVTAASYLKDQTDELIKLNENKQLQQSNFNQYLAMIQDSSVMVLNSLQRASTLISSFKNIAIDQIHEKKQTLIIKNILDNVLLILMPSLEKHNHKITINCNNELQIESYASSLMQVFTHLISNSLLHGFEGIEEGKITIDICENEDNQVLISYHDNGKGIAIEHQQKVFDPFFTTKRNQGGAGLGLHVIYNIICQNMSGSISVDSPQGEGATFLIHLPRK